MSRKYLDLRVLWGIGAVMAFFCGVGLVAAGLAFAIPFALAVLAGVTPDTAFWLWLYASPLWAPIGFGAGAVAAKALFGGMQREEPEGTEKAG